MTDRKPPQRIRLDELLAARGDVDSRSQAKGLILSGRVRLGTEVLDKPGKLLPSDAEIWIVQPPRFVGRGGEKLEKALDTFKIDCEGVHVLDIGASTGGFTDCVLQRGASSATCVDVGHSQLHGKLRADPRVTNLEKTNARYLKRDDLPRNSYDLIVIDVSFISLRLILPAVWPFLTENGYLVALVKPQFEAAKKEADRAGGVIKDVAIQERILHEIETFSRDELPGSGVIGHIDSPIRGAQGNREFLLVLRKEIGDQIQKP